MAGQHENAAAALFGQVLVSADSEPSGNVMNQYVTTLISVETHR